MNKHFLLTISICVIASISTSAQQPVFMKKDNVINLGVGIGGTLYSGYGHHSGVNRIPFLSVSFEHCIMDNLFDERSSLGVGGLVGYTSLRVPDVWTVSNIVIGARGALHYALVDNLDTYAGLTIGYNIHSWKWIESSWGTSTTGNSGLSYAFFAGARYYFTSAIAAFAELGYGYSIINLGLSFRF